MRFPPFFLIALALACCPVYGISRTFKLHQDDVVLTTIQSDDLTWSAPRHLLTWVHRTGHPCTQLHVHLNTDNAELSLWDADTYALVPPTPAGTWNVVRGGRYFIVVQRGMGAFVDRAALPLHAIGTGHDDSITFDSTPILDYFIQRNDVTVLRARHSLSVQLPDWLLELSHGWSRTSSAAASLSTNEDAVPSPLIALTSAPVEATWSSEQLPQLSVEPFPAEVPAAATPPEDYPWARILTAPVTPGQMFFQQTSLQTNKQEIVLEIPNILSLNFPSNGRRRGH